MWAVRSSILVAAAVLVGCAASPPSPPVYAPRAGAPVAVRWEQFCEQATSVSQASWLAGSRGADGWELVSMYNGVLCYKRPEPPRAPPASSPQVLAQGTPSPQPPAPGPVPGASASPVPRILDPGF